ncbi:MAG: SIR2 family protein [Pseudolabrys sp.]|nr:SIR2 family protein [Pseudolabrys sp.]
MDIAGIHDFFALEHLAKALWRDGGTRGAALLLGSGFSRFATLPAGDSKMPPLWNDLKRSIAAQIYAGASESEIPTDPLRLAEEFRAMLGQAALDDFIREQVPDQSWEPGELHESLMRLPWADVLTTNWDTLLERTAPRISDISYETISAANDIARARQPRIVKLHGSLPSGPFIFTEEDYRTYPIRHAAFVNLARQVFLENELCLVGFSGNDPNFLQWSGWVRDHLGDGARRIYLVGVLNLRSATRRLLEQRNVAPIDLAPLVKDVDPAERHATATRLFLEFLKSAEPKAIHAWPPTKAPRSGRSGSDVDRLYKDKAYAADLLKTLAEQWRIERESYPGWLVCPYEKRVHLRHSTNEIPLSKDVIEALDAKSCPRVLFEIAWRFDKTFWPLPEVISNALSAIVEAPPSAELSPNEHLELASIALRASRFDNNRPRFDRLTEIITKFSEPESDHRANVAYQKCLWLRDRLQLKEMAKQTAEIEGPDPVWKLRQANIRCEFGDYINAKQLIFDALKELRTRQQRDRRSFWVLSRRAWAEFLARAADLGGGATSRNREYDRDRDWSLDFKAAKCDPWDELRHVEGDLEKAVREQEKQTFDPKAHFDAGTYVEAGGGSKFTSWTVIPPDYELDRLAEDAAIPISFDWANIRGDTSKMALAFSFEASENWYLRLLQTLRSHSDEYVERYLDRVSVAELRTEIMQKLIDTSVAAIEFWRVRATYARPDMSGKSFNSRAIEQIRFYIEVLSRLVIRSDYAQAKKFYELAESLVKDADLKHWWLLEPIGHLLQRSCEAFPPAQRGELALSAIQFPLRTEAGFQGPEQWPQPITYIGESRYERPDRNPSWGSRIHELIEAVRSEQRDTRADASMRLLFLDERKLLSEAERGALGDALYAQRDPSELIPSNTNFYSFVFLSLPSPDPALATRYFNEVVYKETGDKLFTEEALISIKGAAQKGRFNDKIQLPSREDALLLLDAILAWAPKPSSSPIDFNRNLPKRVGREIGPCLVHAIVPQLVEGDITDARVNNIFRLITDIPAPSLLQVLPRILPLRPDLLERATKVIRRSMMGVTFDQVSGAAHAVERWARNPDKSVLLPRSLVDQLVMAIVTRQETSLTHLIWCARSLLRVGVLTDTDKADLGEALTDLFAETAYDRVESPKRTISLSILRAECVRLSKQLKDAGITSDGIMSWLGACTTDPLPEVRFALEEKDEESAAEES